MTETTEKYLKFIICKPVSGEKGFGHRNISSALDYNDQVNFQHVINVPLSSFFKFTTKVNRGSGCESAELPDVFLSFLVAWQEQHCIFTRQMAYF